MDFLNNANVVISIVVGIFGIGGYIVGISAYFRHKVSSSQQKIITQQHSQNIFSQTAPKSLSRLDWMEVLWYGLEDGVRARSGGGCFGAFMVLMVQLFPAMIIGSISPNALGIYFAVFGTLYFTFLLLFYIYFVGRRIEKKVKEINRPLTRKSSSIQSY
jgi:predicted PurR-regulated permease PerM